MMLRKVVVVVILLSFFFLWKILGGCFDEFGHFAIGQLERKFEIGIKESTRRRNDKSGSFDESESWVSKELNNLRNDVFLLCVGVVERTQVHESSSLMVLSGQTTG